MKTKKLVYGIGINDADYPVNVGSSEEGKYKNVWTCPFYLRWKNIIGRCYSEKVLTKSPTYVGCYTVPEWHYFMNFRGWMGKQDWQGKHLDKDILVPGNKCYGPDTCVFVDRSVNNFLTDCEKSRGKWSIGVYFHRQTGKYVSQAWGIKEEKRSYLGLFNTPEEAHNVWLAFKLEQAKILASEQNDPRVAKALIERYENYGK